MLSRKEANNFFCEPFEVSLKNLNVCSCFRSVHNDCSVLVCFQYHSGIL